MIMNHDNENLKNLYGLANNQPYVSTKRWNCSNTFVESYPTIKSEFKLDGPMKQIKRNFKFK